MKCDRYNMKPLWVAMLACMAFAGQSLQVQAADIHYSATHVFSMEDIQGGFDGTMYGSTPGGIQDPSIICGVPGGVACPVNEYSNQPKMETKGDLNGVWLYPIDSEFGFYTQDFVGAAPKVRDGLYNEGWAGNVFSANLPAGEDLVNYPLHPMYGNIGLALADVATDTYKVTPPWGRWCKGAGGTSVKCETEHYVVMENIRSCYETIPYFFGDPDAANRVDAQGELYDPADYDPLYYLTGDDPYWNASPIGSCVLGQMDNLLYEILDGAITTTELGVDPDGFPDMPPNESSVRYDIAASTHYAITKKDDGKALYRFGNMDKRPNDVRFYARLDLPQEWKDNPEEAFVVTKAKLILRHLITNNPNDQVRSEDMENEGAIGRKPHYMEIGAQWLSAYECYEGDGDYIGPGTVLKNGPFAYTPANVDPLDPSYDPVVAAELRDFVGLGDPSDDVNGIPYPYSSDLHGGFTAGWYTTTDREPFEWAYDTTGDGVVDVSTPVEDPTMVGDLISGPRWRLRPGKFGQDLPGLEVPIINCMPTPYTSEFVKYPVLTPTVMEHNLLDFEEPSPLLTSQGWIKPNGFNDVGYVTPGGDIISVNGTPLTEDFDLAIYVKGDRKTVAVYNATLEIDYIGSEVTVIDASLDSLIVPATHVVGTPITVSAMVTNLGTANVSGSVDFTGKFNRRGATPTSCSAAVALLAPGVTAQYDAECTIPSTPSTLVRWEAVLNVPDDSDLNNNVIPIGTYETTLTQPIL